jgi:hypothetical protein
VKVGDLVMPAHEPRRANGYLGVIIGYDIDNDPVVLWNRHDPEEIDERWAINGTMPEYRSSVEVISESR